MWCGKWVTSLMPTYRVGDPFYGDPRSPDLCMVGTDLVVPADMCSTPALRASAVASSLSGDAVQVDETAVFVYTGLWAINPRVLRMIPTAPLPGKSTRWTSDRRLLKEHHIEKIGHGYVTTRERTAADLLHLPHERGVTALIPLVRDGLDLDLVQEILGDRFRGVSSRRASQMMEQIAHALASCPESP